MKNSDSSKRGQPRNIMLSPYDIKIRSLTVLLSLLPSLLLAAPTDEELAEARWYQVELIVFEHLNKTSARAEHWLDLTGVSLPENTMVLNFPPPEPAPQPQLSPELVPAPISLVAPDIGQVGISEVPNPALEPEIADSTDIGPIIPTPFEMLAEQELQLGKAVTSLRRSAGFRPLLHVAWRQPTYERPEAQPVLIYDGVTDPLPEEEQQDLALVSPDDNLNFGQTGEIIPAATEPEAETYFPQPAEYPSEEDLKIGPPNPRFVGTVKLSISRYLHLDTDLIFRRMTPQMEIIRLPDYSLWSNRPYPTLREPQGPAYIAETWQAIRGFQQKESRRMRSTEIHYLDHPYFGVVVLVTPYELPTPPEQNIPAPRQNIN